MTRILLVDPEPARRQRLREHLERNGTPPHEAMRGLTRFVEERVGDGPARPVFVGHNAVFDWAYIAYYFAHFLIILPLLSIIERPKPLPASISEPVLSGGGMAAGATAKPMEKA